MNRAVLSTDSPAPSGLLWGAAGVLAFSFTVPFTRVAVQSIDPMVVGAGRAVVAGILAAALLLALRVPPPAARLVPRLLLVAGGVVAGFPLLTSLALGEVPASHAAVTIGLLPAATAVAAVLRTRERPPLGFWIAASAGAVAAIAFIALAQGGLGAPHPADLLLVGAVLAAAVGYAEGGILAREIGAWQTICWALVLALPVMGAITALALAGAGWNPAPDGLWSFAYLALVSMFLGFFAWYRGLGIGPMAQVSQVQLVQPVLTISWAALLLGEAITPAVVIGGAAVVACAALAVRQRSRRPRR